MARNSEAFKVIERLLSEGVVSRKVGIVDMAVLVKLDGAMREDGSFC